MGPWFCKERQATEEDSGGWKVHTLPVLVKTEDAVFLIGQITWISRIISSDATAQASVITISLNYLVKPPFYTASDR